jgi:hypothetical protein
MTIHAWAGEKEIYCKTYYSIGGGFIVDEEHFGNRCENACRHPPGSRLRADRWPAADGRVSRRHG